MRNWDRHRSTAYKLDGARFGQPWFSFNVEQQGMIVETWYVDEARRHAVRAFQARNGLKPDRDLGETHSLTRAALNRPASQLQRAP